MVCAGDGAKSVWSEYRERPNCTLEILRDSGRNVSEPMTWLSHVSKEFDTGSKDRTAIELRTLVQRVRLVGCWRSTQRSEASLSRGI